MNEEQNERNFVFFFLILLFCLLPFHSIHVYIFFTSSTMILYNDSTHTHTHKYIRTQTHLYIEYYEPEHLKESKKTWKWFINVWMYSVWVNEWMNEWYKNRDSPSTKIIFTGYPTVCDMNRVEYNSWLFKSLFRHPYYISIFWMKWMEVQLYEYHPL